MTLSFVPFLFSAFSLIFSPGESIYSINKSKSKVNWMGYSLFSFGEHFGSIDIQDGSLNVSNGNLVGGKVLIDMNTIHTLDKGFEEKDGLADHLKSADFFEVSKFPTAILEITAVAPIKDASPNDPNVDVTGFLTLKGIRQQITFPTTLHIDGSQLTAKARFKIDRTKWNVKYNSGKYFDDIGDSTISDAIGISFEIVAAPNAAK